MAQSINLSNIPNESQAVDILTKPLPNVSPHQKLSSALGLMWLILFK